VTKAIQLAFGVTLAITVAAVVTWQATGGDYYTKFEVIEEVEKEIDPDDPLAGTGFYEDDKQTETVVRKDFRLGLLPMPSIFDKHMMSVVTVVAPFWVLTLVGFLWTRRGTGRAGSP
jgi:hypothetical protein